MSNSQSSNTARRCCHSVERTKSTSPRSPLNLPEVMAERRAPCARSPGPGPRSGSRPSCDLRQRLQGAGSRAQGGGSRLGSSGSSRPAQGKLPVPQIGSGGGGKAATSLSQPTTLASSLPKANRSVVGSGDAETPKVNRSDETMHRARGGGVPGGVSRSDLGAD